MPINTALPSRGPSSSPTQWAGTDPSYQEVSVNLTRQGTDTKRKKTDPAACTPSPPRAGQSLPWGQLSPGPAQQDQQANATFRAPQTPNPTVSINKMAISTYMSIIVLNVNGLNAPTKRHRIAEWVQTQDLYIFCLQESHFNLETHTD